MSNSFKHCKFNGNVQVTINIKRERCMLKEIISQSPQLSNSSVSSVKRYKKINHFMGRGQKEWKSKEELFVENINVTEVLKRFRKQSIAEADKNNDINCLRILSLSHIFLINKFDSKKCITKYFDSDTRNILKSLSGGMKPKIIRAPAKAVIYCKKEADEEENDDDDSGEEEKEDEEKEVMLSMVKDLVKNMKEYRASAANNSEASFTDKYLTPVIQRVLLKNASEELYYALIDKPCKNKKKPDSMFGTRVRNKEIFFFFIEIKRPEATSKYQLEDDYAKLMKLMKGSLDDQLCLGVKDPLSLGLLVEGFKCTLFQMRLPADGIYMPMAFERFSLVEELHQLVHLPSIVEALYYVKCELAKLIEKVNQQRKREDKRAGKERVCLSFETKFVAKNNK
ncbi:uncharacterized protein B0P05DRAFT_597268 [Gilbertella persicaria]|uniref:uncharacterized protein n=1 Tax=Gilbertella persicaria TaxID=101096 RepID=UPI00221F9E2C|nr:uncharacterized protein B0P05DRAFT_597268 [Gilbertella persicaria]KAI8077281.1 hypothetical protein B0P05DRAFT_597268 [Gilbertella persicaria]